MTVKMPAIETPPDSEARAARLLNITSYVAKQLATRFAAFEITTQAGAGTPTFAEGDRPCWSVPLILTMPDRGSIGEIGEVLVDAMTGEVLADSQDVGRLCDNADRIAQRPAL
ncbi:MAG: hypothetical protein K2W96_24970 [Gemmataceae bacterium]|nr:hypothetical protein [Gemmataceae bacterium]